MPIVVTQRHQASLSKDSGELLYTVFGTADETEAWDALVAAAPALLNELAFDDAEVEWIAPNGWLGTASYKPPESTDPEAGDSTYSFDTTGNTEHITQALDHVFSFAPPGDTPPDHNGAIGVQEDGSVAGADVEAPGYKWSETHYYDDADIDAAYISALAAVSKTVNDATFVDQQGNSFDAGEAFFHGGSGGQRGDGVWEITYSFTARENKSGQTVGPITGISFKGWDYVWVQYEMIKDTAGSDTTVQIPLAVHVEQVYETGDFSTIFP